MTAKQILEYALIEQNKINAPSLELVQYNYFINKSIDNVLKEIYSYYNPNQIQSDKLYTNKRRIKVTFDMDNLEGTVSSYTGDPSSSYSITTFPIYISERGIIFNLPDDYWHLLAGKLSLKASNAATGNSCNTGNGVIMERPLKRGTPDLMSASLINSYNQPRLYGRSGPGMVYYDIKENVQVPIHIPYSNSIPGVNNGEIEIITGLRHVGLVPESVTFDYLRVYEIVNLTYDQWDLDVEPGGPLDTSQTIEFTNSVCRDIIVELSKQLAGNTKETDRMQIQEALAPQDGGIPRG